MILKGSQRGGAQQLARHLLKTQENEHVEVHELRGFVAGDLTGALRETYAISQATRCRQFLFHLSLNPPANQTVPVAAFENALERIEIKLGLQGQPRAIVFHEKDGRRHAHCVWSRIDGSEMKAVNLPYFKTRLRDVSRELYLEHGWQMPKGLMNSRERNPLNFSLAEWQQAARLNESPAAIKATLQECWAVSDTREALAAALAERGYYLARGDWRGFVAVDYRGEPFALTRAAGIKAKDMRARLGDPASLPSIAEVRARISARMTKAVKGYMREAKTAFDARFAGLAAKRDSLIRRHREERRQLGDYQQQRWDEETRRRSQRMSRGFRGIWDRLTGKYARIRRQNEIEALHGYRRDEAEKERLVAQQLAERRPLQHSIEQARAERAEQMDRLRQDVAHYMKLEFEGRTALQEQFRGTERGQDRDIGGPDRDQGLEPEP